MKKSNFFLLGLIAIMLFGGLITAGCKGGDSTPCCTESTWTSLDMENPDTWDSLPTCCQNTIIDLITVLMEKTEEELDAMTESEIKSLLGCCYNSFMAMGGM